MKIIYLYPALDTVGGADRVITEKANYFADHCGYDVYIVTAHQNNAPIYFPLSAKVKHIDLAVDFNKMVSHSGSVYLFISNYCGNTKRKSGKPCSPSVPILP